MTDDLITRPEVPDFPRITATFTGVHSERVAIDVMGAIRTFPDDNPDHTAPDQTGSTGPAGSAGPVEPARVGALRYLASIAADFHRPVRVRTIEPGPGPDSSLVVTADGLFYDERTPHDTLSIDDLAHTPTRTAPPDSHHADAQDPGQIDQVDEVDGVGRQAGVLEDLLGPVEAPPEASPVAGDEPHPSALAAASSETVSAHLGRRVPHPRRPLRGITEQTPDQPLSVLDGQSVHVMTAAADGPPDVALPASTGEVASTGAPGIRPGGHSFVQTEIAVAPAVQGWQGVVNRVGLRLPPGVRESAWREDVACVSEHWPGPRTIAVANPKGSANKTPTTALLAAVFARYGGAGVLAWDNNETRGSLAWRTQRARHVATVLEMLPQVDTLLAPTAQAAELSHFTHHQPGDKYDVLQSDQSVEGDHEVSAHDVDRVHQVVSRYYRMVVMDSGNSERAANWRAMIEHSDVLVVPCTNSTDTPEAGRLMLESLHTRDAHSRHLATNAVAVVSQRDQTSNAKTAMHHIVDGMADLVAEVVTIPYDPAMKEGVLHFDALRPATQRAWLRAAAAVARRL